jgi:hypothetical protein
MLDLGKGADMPRKLFIVGRAAKQKYEAYKVMSNSQAAAKGRSMIIQGRWQA